MENTNPTNSYLQTVIQERDTLAREVECLKDDMKFKMETIEQLLTIIGKTGDKKLAEEVVIALNKIS